MRGILQVFVRFLLEGGLTAWMAKVICLVLIDDTRLSFLRIYRHFADRIDSYQGFRSSKTRLYDTRYHRGEGLLSREPPGDDGCYNKAQSESGKAEQDASGRFTKGQSQIGS